MKQFENVKEVHEQIMEWVNSGLTYDDHTRPWQTGYVSGLKKADEMYQRALSKDLDSLAIFRMLK